MAHTKIDGTCCATPATQKSKTIAGRDRLNSPQADGRPLQEVRHYCRNPRCRSKLPAPVSNPRDAFCTRGCYNSFYLHRCLVCEGPIEQPKRGKRLICKKAKCRNAWRANSGIGRYHPSSDAKLISKEAGFIGLKGPLKPDRPWRTSWRIVAGPELSSSAFHCAIVGAEEAVERANRGRFSYWREANAKADGKATLVPPSAPSTLTGNPLDLTPPQSRGE